MAGMFSTAGVLPRRLSTVLTSAVLLATGCAAAASDCSGTLVIAGGGVSSDNAALFSAFVDAMPDGKVAVVSAASSSPVGSVERFRQTMMRYGVAEEDVLAVRLAVRDDEDTADVDESQWSDNAGEPEEIAKIRAAGAIWFTGGDQSRLTETLLTARGAPTPMLNAVRERLNDCVVIGGTSAGAAIMSDPMITGGDTMTALRSADGEELTLGPGLGFFPAGLVDQHFGERARLGRLAVALQELPPPIRVGFGVDEDTALVFSLGSGSVGVVGSGNVTIVDGREAVWSDTAGRSAIEGLRISILSPGDRYVLSERSFVPADYSDPTVGNEYNDHQAAVGGGIAMPSTGLDRLLGYELMDNAGSSRLESYSFALSPGEENGRGLLYRFTQTESSSGHWGYDAHGDSRYSVSDVRLDILPVEIQVDALD